ncbi:MAG: SMC-Scp complex subunit ScpB [Candidatus Aenigmarchaeota archaeon ex4484_56]|nr:MAG: SMC-Scp complex subunit ScpB [Candidatus Aenigmarchaeota archaeon ex4484_56]
MIKKIIEASLFLSSRPISIGELVEITQTSSNIIKKEIEDLKTKYNSNSGIKLIESKDTYQFIVNPEVLPKVKKLSPYRDLSPGVLKALSIIAFKGPLKQSALVNTIGNRAYEYVHELEKRGLISAKRSGRTKILKTTKLFEDYFGKKPEKTNLEKYISNEN